MRSICDGLADMATAASSTIVAPQVMEAATATGIASLRDIPRECRHRPNQSSM
jgi:hypothetical protein